MKLLYGGTWNGFTKLAYENNTRNSKAQMLPLLQKNSLLLAAPPPLLLLSLLLYNSECFILCIHITLKQGYKMLTK